MKKITFILLGLISGTAIAQSTAIGEATVNAEIVSPISIATEGTMDFGLIASTDDGGEVTLSPAGTLTYFGDGLEIASNTGSTPTFTVTAQNAYSITLPEEVTISDGSNELVLKDFKSGLSSNNNVAVKTFQLGATLVVGTEQVAGEYSGQVFLTVAYE